MISDKEPLGFNPKFHVVGCITEHDGKILLTQYPLSKKDNPNKWGSPAGKMEPRESKEEAVAREVFEETGLKIDVKKLLFIETAYVRYPDFDFVYHIFRYKIESKEKPKITLQPKEHVTYKWVTVKEALEEDLIMDDDYCIKRAYDIKD